MTVDTNILAARSREELLRRNGIFEAFFRLEAPRLAEACHEMSRRFLAGGRLLAFGNGPAATDAQHVSVEFVHPVIVGKRALDRKSTRLNSSHANISYAVFCLKKKKKHIIQIYLKRFAIV